MERRQKSEGEHSRQRLSILCIDDDVNGSAARKAVLERDGHRVLTCHLGGLGLELAYREKLDLVLLDYELPDLNGFSVAALLRAICPTTRIVMLSARELDTAMAATGILDDYISKAMPVEEFLRISVHKSRLVKGPPSRRPRIVSPATMPGGDRK